MTTSRPHTSSPRDAIDRIVARLDELTQIAPWWEGVRRPSHEGDIERFEQTHGIVLPKAYRRLLLEVGDRAPIPGQARGGLLPLAEALTATTASDFLGPLADPFPVADVAEARLAWDDARDDYQDPPPLRGLLPIGDGGCDVTYHLVVSGAERGQVWIFAPSGEPELAATGQEFLTWYERRLASGMNPLQKAAAKREALTKRLESNPGDVAAAIDLGRDLLLVDTPRAAALIERAWKASIALDKETGIRRLRAVAELDLLHGRTDRIASMHGQADAWLQCYAAVVAARAGHWSEFESLLAAARYTPLPWRSLIAAYRARVAIEAGDTAEAVQTYRHLRSGQPRHPQWQPQRPTLADHLLARLPPLRDDVE